MRRCGGEELDASSRSHAMQEAKEESPPSGRPGENWDWEGKENSKN